MGIRSTRPLPLAHAELVLAPFFKRRFRSWHLEHVRLALQRYRLLTSRFCVDGMQLSTVLGIKEKKLVDDVMRLFLPRTPTRVQCMVDAMEVLIALALVCQAPGMLQRFELIFDIADWEAKGAISTTDLIMLCGAVGRAIMKLFEYKVEPEQHAAMKYVTEVIGSLGVNRSGSIGKEALCKFMVSDDYAVHYAKQCTGEDKTKLYIMLEKDAEFLGAIEFSSVQHMQTSSLRTVRDMIYAQVHRVPEDFLFLCQGRKVEKVCEVDRRAWSVVPFGLRGSPGLRTDIIAKNRGLERPTVVSPFEFRYMDNLITRYKKNVHDIKPVYKHRSFRLRRTAPRKQLEPLEQWHVATTWSGEWIYGQQLIKAKSKAGILKSLRTETRHQEGVLVVKSNYGEILSPSSMVNAGSGNNQTDRPQPPQIDDLPSTPSQPEQRMQRIFSLSLRERKREDKLHQQRVQWKARLIAMEVQNQIEENPNAAGGKRFRQPVARNVINSAGSTKMSIMKTLLVNVEEDNVLPSRLVRCEPKKRRRPKRVEWAVYRWDVPGRILPSLPPRRKHLKVSNICSDIALSTPSGTSTNQPFRLGSFLSSTRISLEENEVEVFPILIIRPIEDQICVNERDYDEIEDVMKPSVASDGLIVEKLEKKPLFASKTYLTEFEYDISATESNFEALYQHIASGTLQDTLRLNRRDIFGRTMLHDAAEFGHSNIMELLLKARVIVDATDSKGDTALHRAARHGRLKEVSMLLREHATPWLLNSEGKSPLYCALETAAKIPARRISQLSGKTTAIVASLKPVDDRRNFFLANGTYSQLRQVIDLLWDNYKLEHLVCSDGYHRTNCLNLEKQIYGGMIQASHDGNLLRIQRLVDLEKRPVLQYINDQLEFVKRTALHEATEQGHTAMVDLLLKLGADGYLRDQRLQTPLHLAACNGYDKIVKCLVLKFPRTASYQDIVGCTPLHLAVQQKHWRVAAELISLIQTSREAIYSETGAELSTESRRRVNCLDLQDIHGFTALHYACIHGNFEICRLLVSATAAVSVSQCEYRILHGTPHLLGMWWKGNSKGVGNHKSLVEASDQIKIVDIEAPVELVLQGCKHDFSNFQERLAVVDLLLNNESAEDSDHGKTSVVKATPSPLYHIAAQLADVNISVAVEICRRLHKLHIEINMTHPRTGETVLLQECKRICLLRNNCSDGSSSHIDEMASQLALVRSLLELGANVDLANEITGESPLGCAARYGHLSLLDLLLEAGADQDVFLRRCSFSPLHFAALGNHIACVKMLIGRSATVNVEMPPTNAETPLFFAIRSKSEEMVDLLLRSNADPCSLCTVQSNCRTSFGVVLSLPKATKERHHSSQSKENVNTGNEGANTTATVVSPLTFGLLVAQSLRAFSVQEELSLTVKRSQRHTQWIEMKHICTMLTKRLLEDNGGSKGLVTSEDVHLACGLGFWELVQMLLSQQIKLSNAPSVHGMNALHLAAAAGEAQVVSALVAGGMNVNCITRSDSPKPKKPSGRRIWYEWTGCGHKGALFYALIHGHTETAAKLLVLGANAEQTIPHTRKTVRWRIGKVTYTDKAFCELVVVRFIVSEAMVKAARTGCIERAVYDGDNHTPHVDEASVNLIHLIECSINQRVPLLHLAVALGHLILVRTLVEAGMSIFSGFVAVSTPQTGTTGINAPAETPIHIAIACGHLEIVQFFGEIVQNHFPGCFIRDGKTFKSLLVTACEARQIHILRFLLRHDGVNAGGGFTREDCKDEFQNALCSCAVFQFTEGFELLVQHGTRPDLHTVVNVLKGLTLSSKHSMASPQINEFELLERDDNDFCAAFPGERYQYDFRKNSVEIATKLLERTLSSEYVADITEFLGSSPIFGWMHKILIICSRYQLWIVLDQIFVYHQEYFLDVASVWKPVLVRAAHCSLVLHRAAMCNQANLVTFFLRLGVPVNLRLGQTPATRCPIWYAASSGSLEAFLCLALRSTSFVEDLEFCNVLNSLRPVFRSIDESRSILSTSNTTCRWQNLSVFGCIDVSKKQTNGYLIQKFINYGLMIARGHADNSLLHHACRRGELIAVQALVKAGADLAATNRNGETPLEVASGRKDGFGLAIVRHLLSEIAQQKLSLTAMIIDRALIRCFVLEAACNLNIARALLDAGANARFSRDATEDEAKACGCTANVSALFYAMQRAQSAGVKLLVDHGAVITVALTKAFLARLLIDPKHPMAHHWRRFSKYLKHNSGMVKLLDVEAIMKILLKNKMFPDAMNPELVYQMLTSASAFAATIAQEVGESNRFWGIVNSILDKYPKEASSRKAERNQKSALHYAVASLELPTVVKLLELREFDLLAEDENKQTPLHMAAAGGDETICRLVLRKLQSNTAKVTAIDVPDIGGRTALHLAVILGHETVANMLLAAGASLDIRCRDGLTALLYAAKCNRLAILIALYSRAQPKPRDALFTANRESGIFVAARHGAFPVVRWLLNLYEDESEADRNDTSDKMTLYKGDLLNEIRCSFGRTILHYAAIHGDQETLEILLKTAQHKLKSGSSDPVNVRDKSGYTPLMYAFAFGRLRTVRLLCEFGADPYASVNHSEDSGAHPYTVGFYIADLLQWFALPGWYSFVCKYFPRKEKVRLVHSTSIDEDYFWHTSYNYRKKHDKLPVEWRCKWKRIPAVRLLKSEPRHRGKELVRTSLRSWRFPRKSIFDYACEIGNAQMAEFLVNLRLPQIFCRLTYQAQRRNFMQAVRWNRLDIVKILLRSATPGNVLIESTTGNHFMDFLESGIDCAVSRGLEDMAIYMINQWQGIKENVRDSATPSAFAFQFASAFQVACIRRLPKLMEGMIERGGEDIIEYQLNEGPALVYAFAFGYVEIASLLLRHGADPTMAISSYTVASAQKWLEFGSPLSVRVCWQPRITEERICNKRPAFVGPLETYDTPTPRLPIDDLCQIFANISLRSNGQVISDAEATDCTNQPEMTASDESALSESATNSKERSSGQDTDAIAETSKNSKQDDDVAVSVRSASNELLQEEHVAPNDRGNRADKSNEFRRCDDNSTSVCENNDEAQSTQTLEDMGQCGDDLPGENLENTTTLKDVTRDGNEPAEADSSPQTEVDNDIKADE